MPIHVSVLPNEIIQWLDPQPGQTFVDGTFGAGGHTKMLAEAVGASGQIIALDRDQSAIDNASESLSGLPIMLVNANYCELGTVLKQLEVESIDGALLDIGLSSDQLEDDQRGFSYHADGELDMRFDTSSGEPAWKLLQRLQEKSIADLIYKYGEERFSRRIARKIVERKNSNPVKTSRDLADLVKSCVPRSKGHNIDPATRTFQALRIAVNDELGSLEKALSSFPDFLNVGGKLAIISFHSLEDRIVKTAFRDDVRLEVLTRKPIRPTELETEKNPRSRSAKLRIAKRI